MLSLSDLRPGCWYMACTCTACGEKLFIGRDLTQGKGALAAGLAMACPKCGKDAAFTPERYYHPPTQVDGQSSI
jgi:hypothetical protein